MSEGSKVKGGSWVEWWKNPIEEEGPSEEDREAGWKGGGGGGGETQGRKRGTELA